MHPQPVVGLITIGQSPCPDITDDMRLILGSVTVLVEGALDNLTDKEISDLSPRADEQEYITRLQSGDSVIISKKRIGPRVDGCIASLERRGATLIVMLCTGTFPDAHHRVPLLCPGDVLLAFVTALQTSIHTLAVLYPLPGQLDQIAAKWDGVVPVVHYETANPYGTVAELETACHNIKKVKPDLTVLDCMGYDLEQRMVVEKIVGGNILLARTAAARVAAELVGMR